MFKFALLLYFAVAFARNSSIERSGFHGTDGPTPIALPADRGTSDRFVMAGEEFGYLRVDLNGNYSEGNLKSKFLCRWNFQYV